MGAEFMVPVEAAHSVASVHGLVELPGATGSVVDRPMGPLLIALPDVALVKGMLEPMAMYPAGTVMVMLKGTWTPALAVPNVMGTGSRMMYRPVASRDIYGLTVVKDPLGLNST